MNQAMLSQALRRWGAVVVAGTVIITSAGIVGVAYAAADETPTAATEQVVGPRGRGPQGAGPGQFAPGAAQDDPNAAQAGANGMPGGRMMGERIRGAVQRIAEKFAVQGEVTAIAGDEITVKFTRPEPRMGNEVTHETTLTLDDASILLDSDFGELNADEVAVGDAVVVIPRLVWGTPTVALLYQGDAADLTDAVYMGELTEIDGDTLTLTNAVTEEEVTVVADSDTIWLDGGEQGRPDTLAEGLRLRVLGVEEDGVVHAVVITPALLQF